MKLVLAVAIFLVLPGCLGHTPKTGTTSPTATVSSTHGSSSTSPPLLNSTSSTWNVGETLEGTDCKGMLLKIYGDHQAVQAAIPSRFQLPGSGPVPLFLNIYQCASATIGGDKLAKTPTFFFTYLDFQNGTTGSAPGYLLEFSSSWDVASQLLTRNGVPGGALNLKVTGSSTEQYDVSFNRTAYSFTVAPIPFQSAQPPPLDYRFFAGPNGSLRLGFQDPETSEDQLPTGCTATFTSGLVSNLKPLPPCEAWHEQTTWTFNLE